MTPQWTPADPGAGSESGIQTRRQRLALQRDHAEQMRQVLARAAETSSEFWSGDGQKGWSRKARSSAEEWARLAAWTDEERSALGRYASEVESIEVAARRQQAILADAALDLTASIQTEASASADELLGNVSGFDASREEAEQAASAARRALASLAEERRAADHRASAAARHARESFLGIRVPSMPAGLRTDDLAALAPHELLVLLSTLSPNDLAALAGADPALADRLAEADPDMVADWWRSLGASERQSLAVNGSVFIGNLDGVDYTHRDIANRQVLASEQQRLEGERTMLVEHEEWLVLHAAGSSVMESPEWIAMEARLGVIEGALASMGAVNTALNRATRASPRQLMSLSDIEGHPKVAVSVGDLDTADHVTFVVPGMGTTVAGSMVAYTRGANNLATSQKEVLAFSPHPETVATIAWLGYEAPGASDVGGVLGMRLASAGGSRLSRSIEGVSASRAWGPESSHLAVVGHSYGSTTAAQALTKTGVGSFVMLGSAGVGLNIHSAEDLRVPSGNVLASQSPHDGWAPVGQIFGLRQDPTRPAFGARSFSSEAETIDGRQYVGVTQHGPLVHEGGAKPNAAFSYLDATTTSIHDTALATVGLSDRVADIDSRWHEPQPR